jgi:undecaprenyl diphosphate synthase
MSHTALRTDELPRHVAIIMDGNGRWAERRGLSRVEGHRAGKEAVSTVVRAAGDLGIEVLTLYAFSIENWNRPQSEVTELMRLAERYLDEELPEVMANDIQVRAIGRLDRLPPRVRKQIDHAVEKTRDNGKLKLVFALSYGGRAEIVDAARRIAREAEQGRVEPDAVDEKVFASYLYDPELPDPDLLIRTGGESRVSNFLLWQIAYSEIWVTNTLWPDFRRRELYEAILDFQRRERRYGGVKPAEEADVFAAGRLRG